MHDHGTPGDPAGPPWPGEFSFCPHCAARLEHVEIGGKPRPRCPACGYVHWRNPGVGAAVVVRDDTGAVLLVKRGPEASRAGLWSVPAGFVDYGEDVREAAARELEEETGLVARVGKVIHAASNFHDPAKLTVGVWFAGEVVGGELRPGDDAVDARFFPVDDLPPLAFDTDRELLAAIGAATEPGGCPPGPGSSARPAS